MILACFFAFRELDTFPAVWADDGLFMMVARSLAQGHGYTFPILEHRWAFPYFLAVGPPLIFPVALSIKLFGFSIAAARLPMIDYLLGTCALLYIFTLRCTGKTAARFCLLLLITLSAFVNTAKPVMGEIPGFFFLLFGLLVFQTKHERKRYAVLAGLLFATAIVTKLTYGLILPSLGIAWLVMLWKKEWQKVTWLTIAGLVAFLMFLPWRFLEMSNASGLHEEFQFLIGEGADDDETLFLTQVLRGELVWLKPPYLLFGLLLLLGSIGLWKTRKTFPSHFTLTIVSLIAFFTVYFVSSFGWYRHVLPAHLLLLPFVFVGGMALLHKRAIGMLLGAIALTQGLYQLDHRGSSRSTEANEAAEHVIKQYTNRDLIVRQQEVFVRLPQNSHWLYFPTPKIAARIPEQFVIMNENQRCMPLLKKLSGEELEHASDTWERASRRYFILPPPADCPPIL
ncbi:hypothetical protein A3D11_03795 [Candidatus Peribacteria bacterium RIFCSPHIGHO2_02_FULL_49_16]|nr:MAG: hypothetical protein A2880_04755 [Candidatus Peribacteria bacterium RIFCSPHIGHO2_01_FULL_49_38]OGJ58856.1 MAG: hypothetical protein A3D11_03795 [Candidatus Peribacteria bacterium RIFCSPHIGHO2_02_FULL_49_16]